VFTSMDLGRGDTNRIEGPDIAKSKLSCLEKSRCSFFFGIVYIFRCFSDAQPCNVQYGAV